MVPHLVKWDEQYRKRGLVILDIDNGAIDARLSVEHAAKKGKKTYPILWDEKGKTCRIYGVTRYPWSVLIGADGKILWAGNPLAAKIEEHVARIEAALGDVDLAALKEADSPLLRTEPGELPQDEG